MTLRSAYLVALGGAMLVLSVSLAAPVPGAGNQDAEGDPLPKGAKARLGTSRMRNVNTTQVGLMPPTYDALLIQDRTGVGYRLVDPATGNVKPELIGSREITKGTLLTVSTDGKRCVTSGYVNDGQSLKVWDLKSSEELFSEDVKNLPYGARGVGISGNGKRFAHGSYLDTNKPENKGKFATATVFDVDTKKQVQTITVVQNQSCNVALSPDGETLITWGSHVDPKRKYDDPSPNPAQQVQAWNLKDGKEITRINNPTYGDPHIAFNAEGSLLAVGGGGPTIDLISMRDGKKVHTLLGRQYMGAFVAFSPDGKTLAATDSNGAAVQRWNVETGALISTTLGPIPDRLSATQLAYTSEDRIIVSCRASYTSVIWEAPSGKLISPRGGHFAEATTIAFTAGGKEILTCSGDNQFLRWNATNGRMVGPVEGFAYSYSPASIQVLTNDGTRGFVTSGGQVLNIDPAYTLFHLPSVPNRSGTLIPTQDGEFGAMLYTSYNEKITTHLVTAWNLKTAQQIGSVEIARTGYDGAFATVLPGGKTLVTMHLNPPKDPKKREENRPYLLTSWELPSNKKLAELELPYKNYGRTTLIGVDANTVGVQLPGPKFIVANALTGKIQREIPLGTRIGDAAPALSPDRRFLVFGTEPTYGTQIPSGVYLFDWATGKPVKKLMGHTGNVTTIAFSPDSKTLATSATDSTVLLWDVESAGELFKVAGPMNGDDE